MYVAHADQFDQPDRLPDFVSDGYAVHDADAHRDGYADRDARSDGVRFDYRVAYADGVRDRRLADSEPDIYGHWDSEPASEQAAGVRSGQHALRVV